MAFFPHHPWYHVLRYRRSGSSNGWIPGQSLWTKRRYWCTLLSVVSHYPLYGVHWVIIARSIQGPGLLDQDHWQRATHFHPALRSRGAAVHLARPSGQEEGRGMARIGQRA